MQNVVRNGQNGMENDERLKKGKNRKVESVYKGAGRAYSDVMKCADIGKMA
ncbi:MAG: hypothetical protein LIV11_04660 [Bacillota bacterium]|nr:hypothetical protein [Bacillota bacterium]